MVVIVTGYTLFVTSLHEVIFALVNQRFSEVCWCNLQIFLHALSLLVVQCVTEMNINYQCFKFGDQRKTQQSTPRRSSSYS